MGELGVKVGVVPHVKIRSLGRSLAKSKPVQFLDVVPLQEALSTHFDTPALFVGYDIEGEDQLPRLAKRDERFILSKGREVYVHTLAIDYDRPKVDGQKSPWTDPEEPWEVLAKLADAPGLWPTAFYSTRHGARLVYVLKTPLLPRDAETAYLKLLDRLRDLGIESDENTKDWTRMFALPFITKDGTRRLWEDPTIFCEVYPESTLDTSKFQLSKRESEPCLVEAARPTDEQCDALLWKDNHQTSLHKRAKDLLKDNPFGSYLFDGFAVDFQPGGRDDKLNAMAWSVAHDLYGKFGMEEAGPAFTFAIMCRGVSQMEPDEDDPGKDWLDVLWEKVVRIWEQAADEADGPRRLLAAGLRRWLRWKASSLSDDELIEAFKREKLGILVSSNGRDHFLIGPTGSYRRHPVAASRLRIDITAAELEWLIHLEEVVTRKGKDGSESTSSRRLSPQEILERHSSTIAGIELTADGGPNYFARGPYGDGVLRIQQAALRNDLEPRFSPEVNEWLRALVAPDQFEAFELSLAYLLAISEGPTASLVVVGPPSCGKKMLAAGLAECFAGPGRPASGQALSTNFNDELLHSPIVHVDEAFAGGRGGVRVQDSFRSLVAGEPLRIEPKGRAVIQARGVHRALCTVNNLDVLDRLAGDGWRTEDDAKAIGDRLAIFHARQEAADLLKRKGGLTYTRGWISADHAGLESSRFVVARHLLWIFSERLPRNGAGNILRTGSRFLFDGNARDLVRSKAVDSSIAPDVAVAVNALLSRMKSAPHMIKAEVAVEHGFVWATSLSTYEQMKLLGRVDVAARDVRRALKNIAGISGEAPRRRIGGIQQRWLRLDPAVLLDLVESVTHASAVLVAAAGQEAERREFLAHGDGDDDIE